MKPIHIPLLLILAAVFCLALFLLFKPDPLPVEEEPTTEAMNYNFLMEAMAPAEAGITQEDIDAYEEAKDDFSDEEKAAFYAGAATAHTELDYGGYLDGQVTEGENTDFDADLLVELMMTDIYAITEDQVAKQSYRAPIFTSTTTFAVVVDEHYPPRFLTEVMVRDALLAHLYPDYGPDREQYFRTGMAMGLYYNSDIAAASGLVERYMEGAVGTSAFLGLTNTQVTEDTETGEVIDAETEALLRESETVEASSTEGFIQITNEE